MRVVQTLLTDLGVVLRALISPSLVQLLTDRQAGLDTRVPSLRDRIGRGAARRKLRDLRVLNLRDPLDLDLIHRGAASDRRVRNLLQVIGLIDRNPVLRDRNQRLRFHRRIEGVDRGLRHRKARDRRVLRLREVINQFLRKAGGQVVKRRALAGDLVHPNLLKAVDPVLLDLLRAVDL